MELDLWKRHLPSLFDTTQRGNKRAKELLADSYLRGTCGVDTPSIARAVYWLSRRYDGDFSADTCFTIGCVLVHA